MNGPDDADIIESILKGNVDDFEIILKRYDAYVFTIVSKHLPAEIIEDAAHEVFIRIYKSLPTYKARAPFQHWISKISVRYCYDFWREKYKRHEIPMATLTEEHAGWADRVLAGQSQEHFQRAETLRESGEVLRWALGKLTAGERMLVTLLYFDELSVKETAEKMGWSVISVKVRAHRVRSKLRKILETLPGGGEKQ